MTVRKELLSISSQYNLYSEPKSKNNDSTNSFLEGHTTQHLCTYKLFNNLNNVLPGRVIVVYLQQSASPSSLRLPPSILTSWDSYKNTGTPTWIFLRSADGLCMFRYITITFLSNTCSKTGGRQIYCHFPQAET